MILNQRITVRRWQYQNRVRKMRQSFYNYSELAETLRHETSLARDLGSSSTGGPPVPGISRALGRQFREIISLRRRSGAYQGGASAATHLNRKPEPTLWPDVLSCQRTKKKNAGWSCLVPINSCRLAKISVSYQIIQNSAGGV